jgi:transitional endoplasmic reticulum ATPase
VLQELLDRDTDVAVLADLNLRPGPQQDLNRFVSEGWVDVRIHLEDTRTAHLRSRLQGELESLGTREGIDCDTEALDLDPVVSVVTDVANAPAERVVRRAADLTVTDAVENPDATLDTADLRLSQSHLDQAAEQIAAEWGGDYDEGWGPGRNDSTEITDADVPDVSFGDIGGLVDQKSRLQEVLTYPSEYADLYTDTKFESSHGVLLTGPPGTGKTMLAKALANETDRTFFAVNGAELKSMWYGQTEQRVQELFETARDEAPSLVFFDEFDAFAGRRDEFTHEVNESVVGTLLAELDGLEDGDDVLVVASTNRPDTIDPAVRRPGRLGETIEVPAPNVTGRKEIAALYLADVPTTDDVTPAWVANYLPEGATGATIEDVCRQALEAAIRDSDTSDDGEGVTVAREHVTAVIESNQAGSERVDPTYQ